MYIGNLDERVTDALVWELMLQAGRIVNVHLPKDRVSQTHQGYGFVEFISEEDAEYAARIMNQVRLYGKPIRVNKVRLYVNMKYSSSAYYFYRHPRISKRRWKSVRSSLSAIWTRWSTRRRSMIRSAGLEVWSWHRRYVSRRIITISSDHDANIVLDRPRR